MWHRRNRQCKKICGRISDLQYQIDRMNVDFKKEIEEVSDKNDKILEELMGIQELLRILIANELLDEMDTLTMVQKNLPKR